MNKNYLYIHEVVGYDEVNIKGIHELKDGANYKVRAKIKESGVTFENNGLVYTYTFDAGVSANEMLQLLQFKTAKYIRDIEDYKFIEFSATLRIKKLRTFERELTIYNFISNDNETKHLSLTF